MKQTFQLLAAGLVIPLLGACAALPEASPEQGLPAASHTGTERIVFRAETADGAAASTKSLPGEGVTLELVRRPMELPFLPTKADAVTSLPSFEVICTNGAAGDENLRWQATFSASGGDYSGDQYWPLEDPSYHFYAANAPLSYAREGSAVLVENDRDVVGAFLESPRYKEKNNLAFKHLFARLGRFTVSAESGKTLSDVEIKITPRSGGRYDLRSGTWSRITVEDPVCISPSGEGTRENDLYLVPGPYTLTASWTVWKRGFSTRKERMTADITLPAGEVTDISTVLGGHVIYPGLTLECLESGILYWKGMTARSIEYSKDEGESWTSVTASAGTGTAISVTAGDVLQFRGYNDNVAAMPAFDIPVRSYAYGDITSLINGTGGLESLNTSLASLFENCTGLESHPTKDLILDCTTLVRISCCNRMFAGCSGLTRAPDLPATLISRNCYSNMFLECSRLSQAPAELPAQTLQKYCYMGMFEGCRSLKKAPKLPATTLEELCYVSMFANCTNLEEAPDLPAHRIPGGSYMHMFNHCISLRRIKCMATEMSDSIDDPLYRWMHDVPPGGHFVKHPDNDWWTTGESGIPEGWTVSTATE